MLIDRVMLIQFESWTNPHWYKFHDDYIILYKSYCPDMILSQSFQRYLVYLMAKHHHPSSNNIKLPLAVHVPCVHWVKVGRTQHQLGYSSTGEWRMPDSDGKYTLWLPVLRFFQATIIKMRILRKHLYIPYVKKVPINLPSLPALMLSQSL